MCNSIVNPLGKTQTEANPGLSTVAALSNMGCNRWVVPGVRNVNCKDNPSTSEENPQQLHFRCFTGKKKTKKRAATFKQGWAETLFFSVLHYKYRILGKRRSLLQILKFFTNMYHVPGYKYSILNSKILHKYFQALLLTTWRPSILHGSKAKTYIYFDP